MDIKEVKKEYDIVLQQLSDPGLISNWEKVDELRSSPRFANARVFEELIKRKEFLERIIRKGEELGDLKNEIEENKSIVSAREDQELISLAETEVSQLKEKEKKLEKELENLLLNYSIGNRVSSETGALLRRNYATEGAAVIVEIRAGAGGDEAALFAKDLFKMYSKYASSQNWQEKILDSRVSELGGFKEIIFELKPARHSPEAKPMAGRNNNVYSKMKYEAGVHRVQRIPETEKSGRIHTSTATVAVLPKPKKTEIKIKPDDLKFEFYRASGPGGQYVNKKETAVRITHIPTGLVVTSQTERSQAQNKENALAILEARFSEKIREKEEMKLSKERKTQIGWAKRSEKIRTYNFPQNRITDHRIKKSWHNIEEVMEGKLETIISVLEKL
jgi:peptide chain release factor 1